MNCPHLCRKFHILLNLINTVRYLTVPASHNNESHDSGGIKLFRTNILIK